jgi:hypothetical protein
MKYLSFCTTPSAGLLIGALALAGCDRPAGHELDLTGGFGNATVNNLVAQTCRNTGAAGAFGGAGKAGATLGDPVVVLDPASTTAEPIYRVYCDGRLDGKYAAITYRDYVRSATQGASVADASVSEAVQ